MSKYTKKEQELLKKNSYTYKVTANKLYFTIEFKKMFWLKYQAGMGPRKILEELGYDLSPFGQKQIDSITQRIRAEAIAGNGFSEGENKSRRKIIKPPEVDNYPQTIQQMQNEIAYLRQEVEFLKKVSRTGQAP